MRTKIFAGLAIVAAAMAGYGFFEFYRPAAEVEVGQAGGDRALAGIEENVTLAERIAVAQERAAHVKGVYMTAAVANDQGRPATNLRGNILKLIDETELNGVVVDVKETDGSEITSHLQPFVGTLHQKNVWVIARIAAFRDNSQVGAHPEYYLKRHDGRIWRDHKGHAWMDPMSPGTRQYLFDFSKHVIDLGFDELQYDYIRFPSDGDTADIVYPNYRATTTPKYAAMAGFFSSLHDEMKRYKPEIILSADLFGYVATQREDLGIGQRLEDIGNSFDYVSPMLYPSHFYGGFQVPADPLRNLAGVWLPYRAKGTSTVASANPSIVVERSVYMASDILAGKIASTSSATSSEVIYNHEKRSDAKIRPWLQSFDLGVDTSRGIYYGVGAVRAQIDAAETAGASGWLLWDPENTYDEAALKKE